MKNKVKKGYNLIAHSYDQNRDQFKNEKYLQKLNKLLKPKSTILDIGCGSGKPIANYFFQHNHKIIGIDISDEQIKLAKQNVPVGNFEVKDMSELKNNEYRVDAVVSFYAIFHIPKEEHLSLLKKINSFLPEKGFILITMGASEWEGHEDFFGVDMHWSHYGSKKNLDIVKMAGFKILTNEIDNSGGEKHQVIIGEKI